MTLDATTTKFALVSHVLPPSPSGQAIVLSRLLRDFSPTEYCLISSRDDSRDNERATDRLHADYFPLGLESGLRLRQLKQDVRATLSAVRDRLKPIVSAPSCEYGDTARSGLPDAGARRWLRTRRMHVEAMLYWLEDRLNLRRRVFQRAECIRRIVVAERCNAIVACSGDLVDLPASCVAARWAKLPFYAYMFDDYATNSAPCYHRTFSREMMRRLMREASGVIVPNEFLASSYQKNYGVNSWIIRNPVEIGVDQPKEFHAGDGPARLLYTGAVYEAHFDAIQRLIGTLQSMGAAAPELHIYSTSTRRYLEQHQIGRPAIIHGAVPADESVRLQREADILFLPLAFDSPIPETINTSAPGKMGELLASGRPVLVHAPKESYVSWYFRRHECGEVVDDKDPEKLRHAIDRLLHDGAYTRQMVAHARERAQSDFALPLARKRFVDMLGGWRNEFI